MIICLRERKNKKQKKRRVVVPQHIVVLEISPQSGEEAD
jgi:hypothetical protein